MRIALDHDNNRINITQAHGNQEYYCPSCGAPLVMKRGTERAHHFAHKQGHVCRDSWETSHAYDISDWHSEWQDQFPKDNQEVSLRLGEICHRADVLIGNTVVEFQHSIMPLSSFEDRNNFYHNCGYKVVWLFDMSDLFFTEEISSHSNGENLILRWGNPKKAFKEHAFKDENVDLFFQTSEVDEKCIIRVLETFEYGFEVFRASLPMTKQDFLSYVGMSAGKCEKPFIDSDVSNKSFQDFKSKFNINLNRQQERALLAIEGSNLLLAVPGSGKTTVLVDRLGYMTIYKGIEPEKILAIAYSRDAAKEMRERFSAKYGSEIGERISFQTINALAYRIYRDYWPRIDSVQRNVIGVNRKSFIRGALASFIDYPTEGDIQELSSAISYIKNMQVSAEAQKEMETDIPHLSEMFELYQKSLESGCYMDFDDQLVFAYTLLCENPDILEIERTRYNYICVDEAQDASKIQHAIIHILANGKNLFMVGDEDQSIYGFRGAFPRAFLNFRYDYRNPYILRMETNYRSTPQITELAQRFISRNKGRYNKTMIAVKDPGQEVELHDCASREAQYIYLLEVAKDNKGETAFLYRNNESSIILVDLFLRNGIHFNLHKPEIDIFNTKIVKEILSYLRFAIDPSNIEALKQIVNRGILYLATNQIKYVEKAAKYRHISIYDALEEQMQYNKGHKDMDRAGRFKHLMNRIAKLSPSDAIEEIGQAGYYNYADTNGLGRTRLDMLHVLAKNEPNIESFLARIELLRDKLSLDINDHCEDSVTLSTIHTSKGKEYDAVYLLDVFDGYFPSSTPSIVTKAKDASTGEQEERRLFYVGLTRAKNKLVICKLHNNKSSYIDELFPEKRISYVSNPQYETRITCNSARQYTAGSTATTLTELLRDRCIGEIVDIRNAKSGSEYSLLITQEGSLSDCNRFECISSYNTSSTGLFLWIQRNTSVWVLADN